MNTIEVSGNEEGEKRRKKKRKEKEKEEKRKKKRKPCLIKPKNNLSG